MVQNPARRASAADVHTSDGATSKSPREGLRCLRVECEHCTEALPRIFGILAQQALIPATIGYRLLDDTLTIELVFGGLDERTGELLLGRIERILTVLRVEIMAVSPPESDATASP